MRPIIVAMFVVFPAIASAHGTKPQQPPTPSSNSVTAAAATVDAFHAALAKGDATAAQALLDDHVQIFEQGWVERSRAEYASHHLESDIKFSSTTTAKRTSRSSGASNDLAYVMSEGTVTGNFNGRAINSVTLETMILRRASAGWRITHIHWSSRDAKK